MNSVKLAKVSLRLLGLPIFGKQAHIVFNLRNLRKQAAAIRLLPNRKEMIFK